MAQTMMACPQCGGQMITDIQQLFDVSVDPMDKERLLRGAVNIGMCPSCGYRVNIATPLVYHDPEKELLLTYFPSEAGVTLQEQEKIIGPLISRVVNSLPPEKKKGYLFQPRSMLTYETLIETILEADGITKDMLNEQKKKADLLRRLVTVSPDSVPEIVKQEEALIDQTFFVMLSNTKEAALQMQDKHSLEILNNIQKVIMDTTEYGAVLKVRAGFTQQAIRDLQELGDKLDRDSLLDLVCNSPDDVYLQTLTGLARAGMDYEFFSKLSSRIDAAEGDEKAKLVKTRDELLSITQQIDAALAEEKEMRKKLLEEILKQDNLEQTITQAAQAIDREFIEVAKEEQALARKNGDFMRSGKIQTLLDTIEKLSTPPVEFQYLEKLLDAEDEAAIRALFEAEPEMKSDQMKQLLHSLQEEGKAQGTLEPEVAERISLILSLM